MGLVQCDFGWLGSVSVSGILFGSVRFLKRFRFVRFLVQFFVYLVWFSAVLGSLALGSFHSKGPTPPTRSPPAQKNSEQTSQAASKSSTQQGISPFYRGVCFGESLFVVSQKWSFPTVLLRLNPFKVCFREPKSRVLVNGVPKHVNRYHWSSCPTFALFAFSRGGG